MAPPRAALGTSALGLSSDQGKTIDRLVDLPDGRHIYLHCAGAGPFTVLLEPGDGGRRSHMDKLFAGLAERYRVCAYDRRNIGQSSEAPTPRKATELDSDLFDTLAAEKVDRPYILFGSSMGGLLTRLHAARHDVAGYVTSNESGSTKAWERFAYPLMDEAERTRDRAWAAGANNERIDVSDVSRAIEAAGDPQVPHIIMISTERFQCPAAGTCGKLYEAFVQMSKATAASGKDGSFRLIDGAHDLYLTNLAEVVAAIDEVAALAMATKAAR
jgi:pimeloyl-ACP methyl ester carboxylesterase